MPIERRIAHLVAIAVGLAIGCAVAGCANQQPSRLTPVLCPAVVTYNPDELAAVYAETHSTAYQVPYTLRLLTDYHNMRTQARVCQQLTGQSEGIAGK